MDQFDGTIGNCSQAQLETLKQFKKYVKEELGLDNPIYDERYLLRFCRAREFKIEEVKAMFKKFIDWRAKNNVDHICEQDFPEIKMIWEFYPHGYYGTTKTGEPVYIERYSNLQMAKIFEKCDRERLVAYFIASYERLLNIILPEASRASGKVIERTVSILDAKGLGLKQILKSETRDFLQIASNVAQDNYPETMKNVYVVNTSMFFSTVWKVVKFYIDKKSRDKFILLGSKYKKELLEIINEEDLPEFLGGTCKEPLGSFKGPWAEKLKKSVEEKTLNV